MGSAHSHEVAGDDHSVSIMRFQLGDGIAMPAVGFGTFQIPEAEAAEPTSIALSVGYRHIDTAEMYANSAAIGRAIKSSGVSRDDLFITTKVSASSTFDATLSLCERATQQLGVKQVDLILVHTPFGGKDVRLAKYRGLVEAQRRGLTRSIGVSNFDVKHLEELAAEGLPTPAANQLELHPLNQKRALLEYMGAKKILPIAYSSLAPLSTWRDGYTSFGGSKAAGATATVDSPIATMAARMGVSEARLMLRYALQKGWPILPKSVREERIRSNFDVNSFVITDDDMTKLDAMDSDAAFAFGNREQPVDPCKAD